VVAATLAVVPDVLVVDDGSTDGTGAAAQEAGARVVRHAENRGKGSALATAFDELFGRGFEAVVTLDADGQHLGSEVPKLLAAWRDGAELVVGSRAALFREMHVVRRCSNTLSTRLLSLAAGRRLPDAQSGFRLYTRDLLERTGFPESGFEAESAVLVRAARAGARIAWPTIELGFADGRLTSHYRPIRDSVRIAVAAVRARRTSPQRRDRAAARP
jgi:glycosyltransferase involved in cell wall biosynthesis